MAGGYVGGARQTRAAPAPTAPHKPSVFAARAACRLMRARGVGARERRHGRLGWGMGGEEAVAHSYRASRHQTAGEADASEQEFQDYLQAPRISAANDPLEWWKANRTRFPTLFPMAKSFLGCPATTAELERVFSKAGKLHDDQRKSVLDVTLEQQLFAAFNWKC
jgi:hypothetical protein